MSLARLEGVSVGRSNLGAPRGCARTVRCTGVTAAGFDDQGARNAFTPASTRQA